MDIGIGGRSRRREPVVTDDLLSPVPIQLEQLRPSPTPFLP